MLTNHTHHRATGFDHWSQSTMRRLAHLFVLGLIVCGCAPKIELAPDAIDANVKWFWVNGDSADDATLLDAAKKLQTSGRADTRTQPLKAQHRERLTPDDLKPFGIDAQNDPSKARGLLVLNVFDCTLPRLEAILSDPDQSALYPRVWESFRRDTRSDRDAFLAGTSATLSWSQQVDLKFPVDDLYTATLEGSLRRVKAADGFPSDFLVARLYLPKPATFATTSTSSLTQNYEIEVFWEQSPGRVFHAYGMWREVTVGGFNLTIEDDGFFNLMLTNLIDWDTKTSALCAK
jgi:hypothetical protein